MKKLLLIVALVLSFNAVFAGAFSRDANAQYAPVTLDIINYSEFWLWDVYIRPSGNSDWGYELLEGTVMTGEYVQYVQLAEGCYDYYIIDLEGRAAQFYNQCVTAGGWEIALNNSDFGPPSY